ncbi:MAG: universal stress protein [Gammaproteobacteria bacterium]|nr:universal stress protein [Gammaproteobacteria bacterium]
MTTNNGAILAIVDPAETNDAVMGRAKEFAKKFDAPIELFSCTYNPYFSGERLYESPSSRKAKAHHVVEEKKRLEALAQGHSDEQIKIMTDVYWDVPEYEAVVRKVLRSKPLMVLRKSEYHSAVDRALMSNDDWNLIRNCPAPVVMVRNGEHRKRSGIIWACVDPMHDHDKPAALDDEIIRAAKRFATALDSEVHLVHAFDSAAAVAAVAAGAMAAEMIPSREIGEQVRETHMQRLQELATKHDISHDRVHNLPGPARVILPAVAMEKNPDMIVMGVVARGFLKRLIIGSTAERILDKLPGDLCVVKPGDFKTRVSVDSPHEFHYQETQDDEQGAA